MNTLKELEYQGKTQELSIIYYHYKIFVAVYESMMFKQSKQREAIK